MFEADSPVEVVPVPRRPGRRAVLRELGLASAVAALAGCEVVHINADCPPPPATPADGAACAPDASSPVEPAPERTARSSHETLNVDIGDQPGLAMDVGESSAWLQARLHERGWVGGGYGRRGAADGDLPSAPGVIRFIVHEAGGEAVVAASEWLRVSAETDGLARWQATGLQPWTDYEWRADWAPRPVLPLELPLKGPTHRFRTMPASDYRGATARDPVRICVVSCVDHGRFLGQRGGDDRPDAAGWAGIPAWRAIHERAPNLVCCTGDSVYYDGPGVMRDTTRERMRMRWHRGFAERYAIELFGNVGSTWQVDDHDYRFNDATPTGAAAPDPALGEAVFREQRYLPEPGYRAVRVGAYLELFLTDSRLHRVPADGRVWGEAQLGWLQGAIEASDATWKIIVSPTPLVGPDSAARRDSHLDHRYRSEGTALREWAAARGLIAERTTRRELLVVCGDRHWQYHAIDAVGLEEWSVGCAHIELRGRPWSAGEPGSSDPEGRIRQVYVTDPTDLAAGSGFLEIEAFTVGEGARAQAQLRLTLRDEYGAVVHRSNRRRPLV